MSEVKTYKLSDLQNWSFRGNALAVLGDPIKHSVSPPMHNAALAEMARRHPKFNNWEYFRFEIAKNELDLALTKFWEKGFRGLNLTVPHKVLAYGSPLVAVTDEAAPIGAVNTLDWDEKGWIGHNTDGYGLRQGIHQELHFSLEHSNIILLGAGGAARGAAVECLQRGCAGLWIINRTMGNLIGLKARLSPLIGKTRFEICTPSNISTDIPKDALVINATSAGLSPTDELPIDLKTLPHLAGVYDMIYNPSETSLLKEAHKLGIHTANGLSMLVYQGARSLSIWSGVPNEQMPIDEMFNAAKAAMAAR